MDKIFKDVVSSFQERDRSDKTGDLNLEEPWPEDSRVWPLKINDLVNSMDPENSTRVLISMDPKSS